MSYLFLTDVGRPYMMYRIGHLYRNGQLTVQSRGFSSGNIAAGG